MIHIPPVIGTRPEAIRTAPVPKELSAPHPVETVQVTGNTAAVGLLDTAGRASSRIVPLLPDRCRP